MAAPHFPSRVAEAPVPPGRGPGPVRVTLSINGTEHAMEIEPRVKLLDAQRERLHMTGAKKGCDHINDVPLTRIEERPDGDLYIGAPACMSDVAEAPTVRERFPMIAQALVLGASAQLRHMAGMGATSRNPRRGGSGSRPVPPRSALP
ncbi:hypothetical protein [Streptomyces sp. NBC_01594]|uniref:hypothetical protein n=1 Tax=Streptomyces sp. NBC_01594 TaxID=2975890 RepID=UPI00386630B9